MPAKTMYAGREPIIDALNNWIDSQELDIADIAIALVVCLAQRLSKHSTGTNDLDIGIQLHTHAIQCIAKEEFLSK